MPRLAETLGVVSLVVCSLGTSTAASAAAAGALQTVVRSVHEQVSGGGGVQSGGTGWDSRWVLDPGVQLSLEGVAKGAKLHVDIREAEGGTVNGKLYVIGGFKHGWSKKSKNTHEYNPKTNKWSKKRQIPVRRGFHHVRLQSRVCRV